MRINKISLWFVGILLAVSGITGCTETPDELDTPAMHLEVKNAKATGMQGEEIKFDITSDRDWEILFLNGEEEWMTIEPMKGTGKATITATLKRNLGLARVGNIDIYTKNSARGKFTINQAPMPSTTLFGTEFSQAKDGVAEGTALTTPTALKDFSMMITGAGSYLLKRGASSLNDIEKIYANGDAVSASSIYSGASGKNYVCMKGAGSLMTFENIRIEDQTDLILTFGCNQYLNTTEYNYSELKVSYRTASNQPYKELTYKRVLPNGWDQAEADIKLPSVFVSTDTPKSIDIKFESTSGDCRLDDIRLLAKEGVVVKFEPMPETKIIPAENIFFNKAIVPASYVYPPLPPAVIERGIAWKVKTATEYTYTSLDFPVGSPATDGPFEVTIAPLKESAEYSYKTYVKDALGKVFFGEELTFTTPAFVRGESLVTFTDIFDEIPANNRVYREKGWDAWHPDSEDVLQGWKTKIRSTMAGEEYPAHLTIVPDASSTKNIRGYAVMPAVNIASATDKSLYINYCMKPNLLTADNGTKLELVISTDYRGVYEDATWTVLKDLTLPFNDATSSRWNFKKIDLSEYATSEWALIAFRYTGKGVEYQLTSVKYGELQKVEYGNPIVTGKMQRGVENSNVKIVMPYKYGLGTPADITITNDAGMSVSLDTPNHATGNGDMDNLVFSVGGTPTTAGKVTFNIAYNDDNTIGATKSLEGAVYDVNGRFPMANQNLMPVGGALPGAIGFVTNTKPIVNFTSGVVFEKKSTRANLITYNPIGMLVGATSWATNNILNPTEYLLITVPVLSEIEGEVRFDTKFIVYAAGVNWIKVNASFLVECSSSTDPLWSRATTGGSTLVTKYNPTADNALPLSGTFTIPADKKVMTGGKLYFRIFVDKPVVDANAGIFEAIKVTHILP